MRLIRYIALLVGLSLVLVACSGGQNTPTPGGPGAESPISVVVAEEDEDVAAFFPVSIGEDEVTISVPNEGLGIDFEDLSENMLAASQHVRIEFPTAALQRVRTQAE